MMVLIEWYCVGIHMDNYDGIGTSYYEDDIIYNYDGIDRVVL
jgi:hypothetical protein